MARKTTKKDAQLDLSGAWYNPENPGWGIMIINYPGDVHSVAVYTYNNQGHQVWMVGAASRGELKFKLNRPFGRGGFDNLQNQSDLDAGTIEFDYVAPATLAYKAEIPGLVFEPTNFSPRPPDVLVFTGEVKLLGSV
jgi:hypothetical protein